MDREQQLKWIEEPFKKLMCRFCGQTFTEKEVERFKPYLDEINFRMTVTVEKLTEKRHE